MYVADARNAAPRSSSHLVTPFFLFRLVFVSVCFEDGFISGARNGQSRPDEQQTFIRIPRFAEGDAADAADAGARLKTSDESELFEKCARCGGGGGRGRARRK